MAVVLGRPLRGEGIPAHRARPAPHLVGSPGRRLVLPEHGGLCHCRRDPPKPRADGRKGPDPSRTPLAGPSENVRGPISEPRLGGAARGDPRTVAFPPSLERGLAPPTSADVGGVRSAPGSGSRAGQPPRRSGPRGETTAIVRSWARFHDAQSEFPQSIGRRPGSRTAPMTSFAPWLRAPLGPGSGVEQGRGQSPLPD